MAQSPSSGIRKEDVRHVADLARLGLSEEEEAKLVAQLDEILKAFARLRELDTENVEPAAHIVPLRNVLRPDEMRPSISRNEVLRNAPDASGAFFRVPRILEEEG
ncbi:MAG: Asp-tRNA(Asn)/Glu-tRNA(Gln) amidotransferase subunit GatC [Firmicutes bacterium]|nr:Asp-tRNA(Asn)/Glu-tRNA(Gln) amidotransferase subunit GatC [Bacillota bacterium]